jgi:hypothetical protein
VSEPSPFASTLTLINAGTKGTFTATVAFDPCGFAVQPKPTTFEVK